MGGEPLAASFLGDEIDDDDLLVLSDAFSLFDFITSGGKAEKKLLKAWTLSSTPTIFASILGSNFLAALKNRAYLIMSGASPISSQTQLVQSYRVTRHRLLASSFFLPIEYTEMLLMWPDPENAAAVEDLPSSFYDLVSGTTNLSRLSMPYSTFAPNPQFPDVPGNVVMAGAPALFKVEALTGTTNLILTVDKEVVITIFRQS